MRIRLSNEHLPGWTSERLDGSDEHMVYDADGNEVGTIMQVVRREPAPPGSQSSTGFVSVHGWIGTNFYPTSKLGAVRSLNGCVECKNTGYVVGQTYGHTDVPEGWDTIQRCDTCQVYDGDEDAGRAYAAKVGTEWRWPLAEEFIPPEDDEDDDPYPADVLVRLP